MSDFSSAFSSLDVLRATHFSFECLVRPLQFLLRNSERMKPAHNALYHMPFTNLSHSSQNSIIHFCCPAEKNSPVHTFLNRRHNIAQPASQRWMCVLLFSPEEIQVIQNNLKNCNYVHNISHSPHNTMYTCFMSPKWQCDVMLYKT